MTHLYVQPHVPSFFLRKMIVILSFVAIRLLQLKEYFEYPTTLEIDEDISCEELSTETEWKILWSSVERKSLPDVSVGNTTQGRTVSGTGIE